MAAKKKAAPKPVSDDETKRRFREALEAKHGRESEGEAHLDGGPGAAQAHGPADTKRTFSRRKTG